jgi:hypothetical protein
LRTILSLLGGLCSTIHKAKVQAEIVPYIGGCDGPRELKIDHKKVSDAFKFNFHEDEKAQYQPGYMEGAY